MAPPWELADRADADRDGRPDLLASNAQDCGHLGCVYELRLATGGPAPLRERALGCVFAPRESGGWREIDCIQRLYPEATGVSVRRVVVAFRRVSGDGAGAGRYAGELEAARPGRPPPGCPVATAPRGAALRMFPAESIRVSERTDSGWRTGPPSTPQVGALTAGQKTPVIDEATGLSGERWLLLGGEDGPLGWARAAALECQE